MKTLIISVVFAACCFWGCQSGIERKTDMFEAPPPHVQRVEKDLDPLEESVQVIEDTYDPGNTLYFSHAFIYEYKLEGKQGEFWIYHNPKNGQLLYVPDDPMVDFVISDPSGDYYFFGEDGHGVKSVFMETVQWGNNPEFYEQNVSYPISDDFIHVEKTGKSKKIGDGSVRGEPIVCYEYRWDFRKVAGTQIVYATDMIPVNFYQVYGFNRMEGDINLPVLSLDFTGIFGKDQSITHIDGDGINLELIAYQFNPYYAEAGAYKFLRRAQDGSWQEEPLPLLSK